MAYKKYQVKRVDKPIEISADWKKPVWEAIEPIALDLYMGEKPDHQPLTQVKLAWDDDAVYVIFRVDDRYIRAAATRHLEKVCRDSCVEFFFTPGTDVAKGYFNLEVNCIGTILMAHQQARGQDRRYLDRNDLNAIRLATSLQKGRPVNPEITASTVWTLEYAVPIRILKKYDALAAAPAPGVVWRANFYKCGDETSHPHWLTWSKTPLASPDFHQPHYFGTLEFMK
jgi:hypothetical protein